MACDGLRGRAGGGAVDDFVRALAANGTDVYVGTDSVNVAGIAQADHVVEVERLGVERPRLRTPAARRLVPDVGDHLRLTASRARDVFVGGIVPERERRPGRRQIAHFDGTAWHPVGSNGAGNGPLDGNVTALATFGGLLVAGGSFTTAGGNPLASFTASFNPGAAPPGGTPTGTQTGTVLLNGTCVHRRPDPVRLEGRRHTRHAPLTTETGTVTVYGNGVLAAFVLVRGTDLGKPIVEFRLTSGNFAACKRKLAAVTATKPPSTKVIRQLWAKGKGKFRTRGRYASATVRGTIWLTADRCDGTLTRVNQGTVQVADFTLKKKFLVHAGSSHLAKKA